MRAVNPMRQSDIIPSLVHGSLVNGLSHVQRQPINWTNVGLLSINILRPQQNCRHFPDDFKCIFLMKIYEFRLRFHWSLFLRFADQATSPYLTQWWLVYWRIHASIGFIELNAKENISMDFYLKFKRFHMKMSTAVMAPNLSRPQCA